MNSLMKLANMTTIVADTGDLDKIHQLRPIEATTNPSLITKAFLDNQIAPHHLAYAKTLNTDQAIDYLTCAIGFEISKLIKGRVSTEVDASLSFDTQKTVDKALEYIQIYQNLGLDKSRVLIKIAATWQGIRAGQILQAQGICCNLTLLFTQTQAQACAEAGVTLISPFVGRITDFQKRTQGVDTVAINDDMGVNSVKNIFKFYKECGYTTQIMGASFRNCEQILALAGCDLLTISPEFFDKLASMQVAVTRQLDAGDYAQKPRPTPMSEQEFDDKQQSNPLNELLLQGIDGFVVARQTLATHLKDL